MTKDRPRPIRFGRGPRLLEARLPTIRRNLLLLVLVLGAMLALSHV